VGTYLMPKEHEVFAAMPGPESYLSMHAGLRGRSVTGSRAVGGFQSIAKFAGIMASERTAAAPPSFVIVTTCSGAGTVFGGVAENTNEAGEKVRCGSPVANTVLDVAASFTV